MGVSCLPLGGSGVHFSDLLLYFGGRNGPTASGSVASSPVVPFPNAEVGRRAAEALTDSSLGRILRRGGSIG